VVDISSISESVDNAEVARSLPPLQVLFGSSQASKELVRNLKVIAGTDLSVLLQGEAGTGKELVACWLHSLSPYSQGRFVRANYSTIEGPIPASETQDRLPGGSLLDSLEYSQVATLFVENVENLLPRTQASLARILQERNASGSPGDLRSPAIGVRIISTTQKDLRSEVSKGTLRPDFFHVISAFTARLLPLRNRLDELPGLIAHFLDVHGQELNLSPQPLSAETLWALQQYPWPGNLRELEDMLIGYVLTGSEALLVEKIAALQRSAEGQLGKPPERMADRSPVSSLAAMGTQQLDDDAILRALRENGWNRRQTARRLQISYRSLLYKLKKMDIASGYTSRYRVATLR
jgi:two-component system response regulator AtoC